MKLSVAMTTYNGERFVAAQLRSIAEQRRLPEELVIFDDASTDSTVGILEAFAASSPFPVTVRRQAANVGSTANFESALRHCSGELIALADQDDVWLPGKLAGLEAALAADPGAGYAFSDAEVVDESLGGTGARLWETVRLDAPALQRFHDGHGLDVLLRGPVVTGATMAFRREFLPLVLPLSRHWIHDGWISLLIEAVSRGLPISESLLLYRRHAGQQVGPGGVGLQGQVAQSRALGAADFARHAAGYAEAATRLVERGAPVDASVLAAIRAKGEHMARRAAMRRGERSRVAVAMREYLSGRYDRFGRGWLGAVADLTAPRERPA